MTDAKARPELGGVIRRMARFALLGVGLALAGCQTDGSGVASSSGSNGRALAFESIDGPPKDKFETLVTHLASQAEQKQVSVVSRAQPAGYRVRGYLSVHTERGKTQVAYVWDVFDADKQRVARISGEESTKAVKGNAWSVLDDAMLQRIAGDTIASLSQTLSVGQAGGTPAAQPATATAAAPAEPAPATEEPAAPAAPAVAPDDLGGVPVAALTPASESEAGTSALAYAPR
ncbi:hypothetical protein ACLBXM_21510 [Xanthobacteraceae bacterium A53D]